jgi:hypothetical protein
MGQEPEVRGSSEAFPDGDFILSTTALSADQKHFLVADNSAFSAFDNRVAIIRVEGEELSLVQTLSPFEDPYAIATSPTNDAALIVSGFGDAIFGLVYNPQSPTPYTLVGEVAYKGTRPQLPGALVTIESGPLSGLVLVAENLGIRRLRFAGQGRIEDLGLTSLGTEIESIVGTLGAQP